MLSAIEDAYRRVAEVMVIGDLVTRELEHNASAEGRQGEYVWQGLFFREDRYFPGDSLLRLQPFELLATGVSAFVIPLTIDSLRMESPGWVQMVGNWNPLKIIAAFISKWRVENTKRLAIETNANECRHRTGTDPATVRA